MMIIGCDFHPSWQQVNWLDTETGEEAHIVEPGGTEVVTRASAPVSISKGLHTGEVTSGRWGAGPTLPHTTGSRIMQNYALDRACALIEGARSATSEIESGVGRGGPRPLALSLVR